MSAVKTNLFLFFRLLHAVTARRLWNSFRIRVGRFMKTGEVRTMPESLSVEPASVCNLRCPECTLGKGGLTRPASLMSTSTFANALEPLSHWLVCCQFYLQGEPTMSPHLSHMIERAHRERIFTMTSTNGQTLTPELCRSLVLAGLDQIIVSVDGTTQEVYEQYRVGGSLQKAIDGIRNLTAARNELCKRNPAIVAQFIVFRHNEHQIADIKRVAREWGADKVVLKTAQIENLDNAAQLLPQNQRYSRYTKDSNGNYFMPKRFPINCKRLRQTMVVDSSGNVLPCCYDKNGQFVMGNVNEQSATTIWKNQKFNMFRQWVWHTETPPDICLNCNG